MRLDKAGRRRKPHATDWSKDEIDALLRLAGVFTPYAEIARQLGRTESAVKVKISALRRTQSLRNDYVVNDDANEYVKFVCDKLRDAKRPVGPFLKASNVNPRRFYLLRRQPWVQPSIEEITNMLGELGYHLEIAKDGPNKSNT